MTGPSGVASRLRQAGREPGRPFSNGFPPRRNGGFRSRSVIWSFFRASLVSWVPKNGNLGALGSHFAGPDWLTLPLPIPINAPARFARHRGARVSTLHGPWSGAARESELRITPSSSGGVSGVAKGADGKSAVL